MVAHVGIVENEEVDELAKEGWVEKDVEMGSILV